MSAKRLWAALALAAMLWTVLTGSGFAQTGAAKASQPRVLIVYSAPLASEARAVAALNGHFPLTTTTTPAAQATDEALRLADYVIVLQDQANADLSKRLAEPRDKPARGVLWIGASAVGPSRSAIDLEYRGQTIADRQLRVLPLALPADAKTLAWASDGPARYPLAAQSGRSLYFASLAISGVPGLVLADLLHDFYGIPHTGGYHETFLRIDAANPTVDPAKLIAMTDLLASRRIPFLFSVAPAYPDGMGGLTRFEDKPAWTAALRYMAEHGGSLVMAGYEQRYHAEDAPPSAEFWDAGQDKPIGEEEAYTAGKIEKGIARLAANRLYPLAFEAPRQAMSQAGYEIAARYFSTLTGYLQAGDETAARQAPVLYRLLPGAQRPGLLPETPGVAASDEPSISAMLERAKQLELLRDSTFGAVISPELPLAQLTDYLNQLQKLDAEFVDLRNEQQTVKSSFITIEATGDGVTATVTDEAKLQTLAVLPKRSVLAANISNVITWGIAIIVTLFLLIFVFFLVSLRGKRRFRLFGEETVR